MRALVTDDHTLTDALGNRTSGAGTMLDSWTRLFDAIPGYGMRADFELADGSRVVLFGEAGGKWRVNSRVLIRQGPSTPPGWARSSPAESKPGARIATRQAASRLRRSDGLANPSADRFSADRLFASRLTANRLFADRLLANRLLTAS